MQKILVLNPKGGSGKTTVATNLASYFAVQDLCPVLMDMDAQGSSTRWLSKRGIELRPIHGIATYERNSRVTRSFALRIPQHCQRVVVDTPAALDPQLMPELTRDAHAILVPVLPSDIDIHAAAKCITNLLLVAKVPRESQRIGVIANRVKKNTVMYRSLMRFLGSLDIPILATFRDSQTYIRAAEAGVGIFEMKPNQVRDDLEQWLPLIGWLSQKDSALPNTTIPSQTMCSVPNIITQPVTAATPLIISESDSSLPTLIEPRSPVPAFSPPRHPSIVTPTMDVSMSATTADISDAVTAKPVQAALSSITSFFTRKP
jgi:chromosome partitioning protein